MTDTIALIIFFIPVLFAFGLLFIRACYLEEEINEELRKRLKAYGASDEEIEKYLY